jgi:hypothetical protein
MKHNAKRTKATAKTSRRKADDLVGGSGALAFHGDGGAAHHMSPAMADAPAAAPGFASQQSIAAPDNAQETAGDEAAV